MSSNNKDTFGIRLINCDDAEVTGNYVSGFDTAYSVEKSNNLSFKGNVAESTQAIILFEKIDEAIRNCQLEKDVLDELLALNKQMKEASGTPSFIQKYKTFSDMVSTHVTILGPSLVYLLPQLVHFIPS